MEPIPMEWVEKLFACMTQFYGEKWERLFLTPSTKEYAKSLWQSGLSGLTYDQIKGQLQRCKRESVHPQAQPPHLMEFFRFAKNAVDCMIDYNPKAEQKGDPEIARSHLDEIRGKLTISVNR